MKLKIYDVQKLGEEASKIETQLTKNIESLLASTGLAKAEGDGCEKGQAKWEAHVLCSEAVRLVDGEKFMAHPATTEWTEFRPTAALVKTNEGSAFEEWAQRGEGRTIKVALAPQKRYGMGEPTDDRVGDQIFLENCPCLVELRDSPFVSVGTFADLSAKVFGMKIEIGHWEEGVMVEGDFQPSKALVVVSNWALPTVGEQVLV